MGKKGKVIGAKKSTAPEAAEVLEEALLNKEVVPIEYTGLKSGMI